MLLPIIYPLYSTPSFYKLLIIPLSLSFKPFITHLYETFFFFPFLSWQRRKSTTILFSERKTEHSWQFYINDY